MTGEEYKTSLLRGLKEKPHIKQNLVNKNEIIMTAGDIVRLGCKAVSDVSYYDLKHDRKQILELMHGETSLSDVALVMLDNTLKIIDGRLSQFSDEEKAVYDAVYGDNI